MERFDDKSVETGLRELPKFTMDDSHFERIETYLKTMNGSVQKRTRKGITIWKTTVLFAGVATAAMVVLITPLRHSLSQFSETTSGRHHATKKVAEKVMT